MKKVLILRSCKADLTSFGGFRWPSEGPVEAPDWRDDNRCGGGLHGALFGEGDGTHFEWSEDAKWLVFEADAKDVRDLNGKVKVPRGVVVFCGDRFGATSYLAERAPGRAIIGGMTIVGDRCTVTVGSFGTAVAGNHGTANAGFGGTASAGVEGIAIAGLYGTATVDHYGIACVGNKGTATAGDQGISITGYNGRANVGNRGIASAGVCGEIRIRWWDGNRHRLAVGYVGEGLEPDTFYQCVGGDFIEKPMLTRLAKFIGQIPHDTFPANICVANEALGYTNRELAVALDVSIPTISRWKDTKNNPRDHLQQTVRNALLMVALRRLREFADP